MESSIIPINAENFTTHTFNDLARTPENHFHLCFYTAVYRMVRNLRELVKNTAENVESMFDKYPAAGQYFTECVTHMPDEISWEEGSDWWEENIAGWLLLPGVLLPLQKVRQVSGYAWDHIYALLAAGLMEEDSRFGGLFAELQSPLNERRPSLSTMSSLFRSAPGAGDGGFTNAVLQLIEDGFLSVLNRGNPRADWIVRIPDTIWEVLHSGAGMKGIPGIQFHRAESFDSPEELILPADFVHRLTRFPAVLESHGIKVCIIRGSPGSDRIRIAGALARFTGKNLMATEGETIEQSDVPFGPLCTLLDAVPAITCEPGPGETYSLRPINGYSGLVNVIMGEVGGLAEQNTENAITLKLPILTPQQRLLYWQRALPDQPLAELETINERFCLPPGYIRRVARTARAQATLEGRDQVTGHDVRNACATLNRQLLDTLAEAMPTNGTWDHLIAGKSAMAKLRELERRCRYRERLLEHLGVGFSQNSTRGVRALFTGPSGTGKTLAARILASELDVDLYRVDLAAVINKYVGETEKNLHRILSIAEELDVVLLLDEGDALLGSRTEVRTANDRYANLETNYLLQKLESYQGIVITTTNLGENIDKAFERRMDLVVEFLPPDPEERWHIWQLHLPEDHRVGEKFLNNLAVRCELTGGQIRNAAQLASLLSLESNDGQVGNQEVDQAVRSEYRKAGATCPLSDNNPNDNTNGDITSLLEIL